MLDRLCAKSGARMPGKQLCLHCVCLAVLACTPMLPFTAARANTLEHVCKFRIPAESLRKALLDFARQAHLQLILPDTRRLQARAPGLVGRYTERRAVRRLLEGTGLKYTINDSTVAIFPSADARGSRTRKGAREHALPRRIQTGTTDGTRKHNAQGSSAPATLRQVIVTGTHIRGSSSPSVPIISITHQQIRDSGYQTLEQVMDALPENFNALGSESNDNSAENDSGNVAYGAAVDLMGLGYDSTLVLVNGHRLAPAGINGAFTDISVIPLDAVKRIDVMTDGASAIYGADAIGGVVNYVLRNRLRGGDTTMEYGSVTHGSLKDYRFSQSYGMNWTSGHALLSYEYHDETPLNLADRKFSASLGAGYLTPGLTQTGLLLTAGQKIGTEVNLHAQVFYSRRRNTELAAIPTVQATVHAVGHANTAQGSYALGAAFRLPGSWRLETRVSYGTNTSSLMSIDGTLSGKNELTTASAVLNGTIWQLPAGKLKGAVGAQVRLEALSDNFLGQFASAVAAVRKRRRVDSVFVETEIPILPATTTQSSVGSMTADVAARMDHYSDFGTAFDPRLGLAWQALRGIKIRGTISTSFKAPSFYELYGAQDTFLVNSPEPGLPPGSSVAILFRFGSNPNLKAEKARQWTVGLDLTPAEIPGLTAHLTYYNVNFRDRIADVGIPLIDALGQEQKYAAYINTNPSSAQINAATTNLFGYENLTPLPGFGPARTLADVTAIADNRYQNIGQTRTSGMNVTGNYARADDAIHWLVGLNAAYIFAFQNIPQPGSPGFSVLSTLNNPINFRARARISVRHAAWGLNAFVNYVNHYSDPTTGVPVHVASWTTVDLSGSYRLFSGHRGWAKASLLVSCVNCLNRAPPAVRLLSDYLGYDPENANALGRFVSASLNIRW